jgi:hypothetical protein
MQLVLVTAPVSTGASLFLIPVYNRAAHESLPGKTTTFKAA